MSVRPFMYKKIKAAQPPHTKKPLSFWGSPRPTFSGALFPNPHSAPGPRWGLNIIIRQWLWCCHHGRAIATVHPVFYFDECWTAPTGRRPKTKPDDLGCESACTLSVQAAGIYPHHHHLLLLLSPKADTHFTVPQRVEGWVDLAGWLHTEMVYPSTDGHPSRY